MASKIKVDQLETADGTGTIALQNQLSGMTTASLPTVTTDKLGTGAVLQVVQHRTSSASSTTSSSYVSTGFTGTITPSSTSSKILITGTAIVRNGSSSGNYQHTIYRGSTNLAPVATRGLAQVTNFGDEGDAVPTLMYLDSPNTTSQITYTWYHKSENGNTCSFAIDSSYAQLTLMEIAG